MRMLLAIVLAISPATVWQRVWHETNSHAAASRGSAQYSAKRYDQAAQSFAAADKLARSPRTAFDLGTAHVAAGKNTEGSAALSRAMEDPALRADSLYNRGNSALAAKAYEYAVRDYIDVLKLRPGDAQAKRNLEIALERMREMKQSSAGRQGQQQPSPSQQQKQKSPSAGQREEPQEQRSEAEALLRSVQQQEQEEMQRMKRSRVDTTRVGW
jgi:tetratricopeptide (TPR) repeat protein